MSFNLVSVQLTMNTGRLNEAYFPIPHAHNFEQVVLKEKGGGDFLRSSRSKEEADDDMQ